MVLKGWTSFMMFLSSICLLKLQYNQIYPKILSSMQFVKQLMTNVQIFINVINQFSWVNSISKLSQTVIVQQNQNKQEIIIQINTKMQILNYNNRRGNKENENGSPQKQILKMKIQLNDRIFEYHKLEEDYAQEKAKLIMEFQKERVGLNRTVKELKEKNIADNQQWTKKIDQIRKEKEQAITSLTSFYEQEIQRKKEIITQQASIQFKRQIETLKNQNQKIRNNIQNYQMQWKKQKQQMTANFKIALKRKAQEKQNLFNSFLEGVKSQYQQKILSLQRLYIKEEQLLKQTEKQLFDKVEQHVKQTLQLQNIIRHYKYQNQELTKKLQNLEHTLKVQKENFEKTLLKKAQQQNRLKANNAKELQKIKEQFQNKLEVGNQNHSQQIAKFKDEIVTLQKIYKERQQIWDERGKKVLQLFQKRESKKQDLKTIQSLQIELLKKDFMIQRQRKQLKNCKLELQNMQDIYDKMFISNAHLSKLKSKSFKVKKLKTSCLMNSSNRSTVIQMRRMSTEDK